MAAACGAASLLYPGLEGRTRVWVAVGGAALLLATAAAPRVLRPANRLWTALGRALHAATGPLVLAAILYGVITPIGLIMRWSGKDPLRLRTSPGENTYWIRREPSVPRTTMRNQF